MRPLIALAVPAALLAACAWSDATDGRPQPPVVVANDTPEYDDPQAEQWFRQQRAFEPERIVAGDIISIKATLEGVTSRPLADFGKRVPPNGVVVLPRLETAIQVLDKTPQELEQEIAELYAASEEYDRPYVLVAIEESAPREVFILGAVESPGRYDLGASSPTNVLKALTIAGGPTRIADLERVRIQRFFPARNAEVASPPLDIKQIIEDGVQKDNLVLEPGDTLMVPEVKGHKIFVTGHVERNGPLPWRQGMTLSEAISEMGGYKRFAKRSAIKVNRRHPGGATETIDFDYDAFLDGDIEDLPLLPGDSIFVPEKWI